MVVPVIAVFTKFDDFINQVFDQDLDDEENREAANTTLDELQAPLFRCKFPPRASVRMEDLHLDDGDHQEQVKALLQKTSEFGIEPLQIRYRRLKDGPAKSDERRLAELRKLDKLIKGIQKDIGELKVPLPLKFAVFREGLSERVSDMKHSMTRR
ncbi:hypothetical protein DXG01_005360 [Tephrocybe rancida]|nr:hypothetical protein DXG01_005360 [Tephrocybe rancida]